MAELRSVGKTRCISIVESCLDEVCVEAMLVTHKRITNLREKVELSTLIGDSAESQENELLYMKPN